MHFFGVVYCSHQTYLIRACGAGVSQNDRHYLFPFHAAAQLSVEDNAMNQKSTSASTRSFHSKSISNSINLKSNLRPPDFVQYFHFQRNVRSERLKFVWRTLWYLIRHKPSLAFQRFKSLSSRPNILHPYFDYHAGINLVLTVLLCIVFQLPNPSPQSLIPSIIHSPNWVSRIPRARAANHAREPPRSTPHFRSLLSGCAP